MALGAFFNTRLGRYIAAMICAMPATVGASHFGWQRYQLYKFDQAGETMRGTPPFYSQHERTPRAQRTGRTLQTLPKSYKLALLRHPDLESCSDDQTSPSDYLSQHIWEMPHATAEVCLFRLFATEGDPDFAKTWLENLGLGVRDKIDQDEFVINAAKTFQPGEGPAGTLKFSTQITLHWTEDQSDLRYISISRQSLFK